MIKIQGLDTKVSMERNNDIKVKRVIAFFGSDLDGEDNTYLQSAHDRGYTLLALDISAVSFATRAQVPYTLVDDWVSDEIRIKAKEIALEFDRTWFEAARDEFTVDEICWPEFDRHAMLWFWLEVSLANSLAEEFFANDISRIKFFKDFVAQPSVYYSPSGIYNTYWEAVFGYKAEPIENDGFAAEMRRPLWRRLGGRARALLFNKTQKACESYIAGNELDAISGKILLVFNPGEAHRFAPIIQELSSDMPGKIAVVIVSSDRSRADELASSWAVPVVCGSAGESINMDLQNQFWIAYQKAVGAVLDRPLYKPLKYLEFHFKYFCQQRWPMLVNSLQFWCQLWAETQPEALIISSLYDSESQLPTEAAKRLGIPTFSIPHGAVQVADDLLSSENILYSYETQKLAWERAGIASNRLRPCRNIMSENEYPMDGKLDLKSVSKWRVLVLTNPVYWAEHRLLPGISLCAQLEAIQALDNPPEDVAERLELWIKAHPGCPELELFYLCSDTLAEKVVPSNVALRHMLEKTDLVIAVNYFGSALVNTLRLGKPIVSFETDPKFRELISFKQADLFAEGCQVARNPSELWRIVRSFFTDRTFADEAIKKAQGFYENHLDDSRHQTISELVGQTLLAQKGLDSASFTTSQ